MRMHARTRTHHAHDAAPAQAAVLRHPAEEREPEGAADALERVDGYLPNPPHPALRSAQAVSRTLEHAWRAPRRRPACREGRELEQGGEDSEDVGHGHACVSEARHALVAWMPLGGVTGSGVSPSMSDDSSKHKEGVVVLCLDIKSAFHELRPFFNGSPSPRRGPVPGGGAGLGGRRAAGHVSGRLFLRGQVCSGPGGLARAVPRGLPPQAQRRACAPRVRGLAGGQGRLGVRGQAWAPPDAPCAQGLRAVPALPDRAPPRVQLRGVRRALHHHAQGQRDAHGAHARVRAQVRQRWCSPVAICAACLAWLTLRQPFARGVQPSAPS